MNRGIDKKALENPEVKGKKTKVNPIRLNARISVKTDEQITEISQVLLVEKSAAVRMLLWFAIRFAEPAELPKIAEERRYMVDGQAIRRIDTRITQEMLDCIENLMAHDKSAKSNAVKILLYWALENIGRYSLKDLLENNTRK